MRKWDIPKLLTLGFKNSFYEVYAAKGNGNGNGNNQDKRHWCHKIGDLCDEVHNGKTDSHTSVNARHHHPATGDSISYDKCCCSSTAPGQS